MDMSALATLTPEEKATLKAALDQAEEADPLDQALELIEYLCDEVKAIKDAHEALKSLVMEDLIGGIKEAYDGNVRAEKMEAFKGKFGSMLDPLAEKFKSTFGADLHDQAFGYMGDLEKEDGYTDELGESKIKEVIQQIKAKLGIADEPAAVVTTVEAAPAPEAKAEEEPEEEEVEPDAQAAWNEIEAMKKRDDKLDEEREKRQATRKGVA